LYARKQCADEPSSFIELRTRMRRSFPHPRGDPSIATHAS
jgi:hypothetical protein